MSNKVKGIIGAVLALLCAMFAWYSAYSDNDPVTKPDTDEVVESARGVYDAVTVEGDAAVTVDEIVVE